MAQGYGLRLGSFVHNSLLFVNVGIRRSNNALAGYWLTARENTTAEVRQVADIRLLSVKTKNKKQNKVE